jgi:HAD superfamily hydrolase (TIGR01509 family)
MDAVLLDMDGVLLDTFDAWLSLMNTAAAHFGHPPIEEPAFRRAFGGPTEADVDQFFPSQTVQSLDAYYEAHFADHAASAKALPGARTLLDALDNRGLLTAVITNTASGLARRLLESLELVPHALVGGDDVERPKPAPDMVFRACTVLGVEPWNVLVVGDSTYDKEAAAAAGAPFAGIGGIAGNFTLTRLDEVLAIVDGTFR